jgi:drug/metabolite transporter (DMT)-like permease
MFLTTRNGYGAHMGIGLSIVLLLLGIALLGNAVSFDFGLASDPVVGALLLVLSAVVFAVTLKLTPRKRRGMTSDEVGT